MNIQLGQWWKTANGSQVRIMAAGHDGEQPIFEVAVGATGNTYAVSREGVSRTLGRPTTLWNLATLLDEDEPRVVAPEAADNLPVPGYERLATVLQGAYDQAARTKGAERHANAKPFHEQPMQTIAERRGIGFLLGQVDKKTEEAQGMVRRGDHRAAIRELEGAINYIAGTIIAIQDGRGL